MELGLKMDVLYFGSVQDEMVFEENVARSKVKPSSSAEIFEMSVVKSLSYIDECELTILTAPVMAAFPGGHNIFIHPRKERLFGSTYTNVLASINLPVIKPYIFSLGLRKKFIEWEKTSRNTSKRCVLTYGINSKATGMLIRLCKEFNVKIVAILADSPSIQLKDYSDSSSIKRLIKSRTREYNVSLQDKFDAYIFFTKYYTDLIPGKKYMLLETIVDLDRFMFSNVKKQHNQFVIMYAGTLYKKYGIDSLVGSMKYLPSEYELWIFGSGDYENEIISIAQSDKRIKYYGRKSSSEIVEYEKEADLLINIRPTGDEYTKYSFPSKTVEYMMSGTPVLTTKLYGIPDEYFDYVFTIDDLREQNIADTIIKIAHSDREKLNQMGFKARDFIVSNKTTKVQGQRIYKFLHAVIES